MGEELLKKTGTAQIGASLTDGIACWFLDTDYNEETFFVRHAYFTGAEESYEKLKALSAPRSTKPPGRRSIQPRAAPSTLRQPGKIRSR